MDCATVRRPAGAAVKGGGGRGPVFECDGATLYRGDCLQILSGLPAAKYAAVITDPPYCSGGMTTAERARLNPVAKYCHSGDSLGRASFEGDQRDQRGFLAWCTLWLSQCRELTRRGGRLLVFSDWRQLPSMTDAVQAAGWTWRGIESWNKGRGSRAPHTGYHRHQCEYLVFATNGPCPKMQGGPFDGCYDVPVDRREKRHITGKPVKLLRQLVRTVEAGAEILDPFAGSCSLGVAAMLEGRRATLIEQSAEYCAVGDAWLRSTAAAGRVTAGAA